MENKKIIAITGPTFSGKTTVTDYLINNYNILLSRHVTTRLPRVDDKEGFYKYLNIEDFNSLRRNGEFLIESGFNDIRYGILKEDIEKCLISGDAALINMSYKDIKQYLNILYQKYLITLTFSEIESGILNRCNTSNRQMEKQQLDKRILAAKADHDTYFNKVKSVSDCLIYTDLLSKEDMLEEVDKKLIKSMNIRKR